MTIDKSGNYNRINKGGQNQKMKSSNEWAKTILYIYKYLERVTEGIDKLVSQNALNSYYYCGESQIENGVLSVAERIINLSARKARLINIKVLADKALMKCKKENAQILIERYMDNDMAEIIAQNHNLNIRTYFRRLYQAEVEFCSAMAQLGFSDKYLKEYLKNEKWILEVYENFKNEKKENLLLEIAEQ